VNPVRRAAFDDEMARARAELENSSFEHAFAHLERAHVLGQEFVVPHVRSHARMLALEIRRNRPAAAFGQAVRIVLGAVGSAVGRVPTGNTGGSDVNMFRPMPIEPELQSLIEGRREGPRGGGVAGTP
jgi:hypothetical protein